MFILNDDRLVLLIFILQFNNLIKFNSFQFNIIIDEDMYVDKNCSQL